MEDYVPPQVVLEAYIEDYVLRGGITARRRDVVRMLMRRGYRRRSIHAAVRKLRRIQHLLGNSEAGRPAIVLEECLYGTVIDRVARQGRRPSDSEKTRESSE